MYRVPPCAPMQDLAVFLRDHAAKGGDLGTMLEKVREKIMHLRNEAYSKQPKETKNKGGRPKAGTGWPTVKELEELIMNLPPAAV